MNNQYTALSKFYEKIIYDDNYKTWINYIVSLVKNNSLGNKGIDVACGTGILTRRLKASGYDVVGVDISQDMLNVAQQKSFEEKLNIKYLNCDMKNLKSFEKVDFITAINDGLNYVDTKSLNKTFKSFYNVLKKGGLLIFDVSSEYKLKNVLGNNAFGDDDDLLTYLWLNTYNESQNAVEISLSIFEKDGDNYIRHFETQTQYVHTIENLKEAFTSANFNVVSITDSMGEVIKENTDRILFILKK